MMYYKITLNPLMPYFFGGENTFGFGRNKKTKTPYYIISEDMPSQTTLFGMLRYMILKKKGLLNGKDLFPDENEQKNAVGSETFRFDDSKQNFGIVDNISPLFLSYKGSMLIPSPCSYVNVKTKDKKSEKVFIKLRSPKSNIKNFEEIKSFPYLSVDGEDKILSDKEFPVGGFVAATEKDGKSDIEVYTDLIESEIRIGINSHRSGDKNESNEKSFFKKEYRYLKKGCSFVFYVCFNGDFEDVLPENDTVFMGQGKSPFGFFAQKVDESEYDNLLKSFENIHPCEDEYSCYMALSDCYLPDNVSKDDILWQMITTRPAHNLIGKPSEKSFYNSYKRADKQVVFINKGSVFFVKKNSEIKLSDNNIKMLTIGMNKIIKIGG